MNKIILIFLSLICFESVYAASPVWLWKKSLSLEKEQVYTAHFKVGGVQKELKFRWTLFKNYGLVMHLNYDKFNHQFLFYTDYQRNTYKIPLGMENRDYKDKPYLVMYFKSFSDDKAHLNLYIEGQGAVVLDDSLTQTEGT